MNLTTLVEPDEAKARLDEYRSLVDTERTAEDDAIAAGYRAAARGLPVISLRRTIAAGGQFGDCLPRLAVARADALTCHVRYDWSHTSLIYSDTPNPCQRGAFVGRHHVRVDVEWAHRNGRRGSTVVPVIPPRHRPNRRRLHGYHVLWEVESWTPEPPVDPALIRHIRGDLWAVVATWDLTELERLVLAQRRRP